MKRNNKGQFVKGYTFNMSDEHKRKIGKAHKGKKRKQFSKEWRANISKGLIGNKRNWKGGKIQHKERWYIRKNGIYIAQTRLVMQEKLERKLKQKEIVHHINEIKSDDRIENLYLMRNRKQHSGYHRNCEFTYKKWGLRKYDSTTNPNP